MAYNGTGRPERVTPGGDDLLKEIRGLRQDMQRQNSLTQDQTKTIARVPAATGYAVRSGGSATAVGGAGTSWHGSANRVNRRCQLLEAELTCIALIEANMCDDWDGVRVMLDAAPLEDIITALIGLASELAQHPKITLTDRQQAALEMLAAPN